MRLDARRGARCETPAPAPRLTTPMIALAFSILNCPEDAEQCGKLLARKVLDAADGKPR